MWMLLKLFRWNTYTLIIFCFTLNQKPWGIKFTKTHSYH